MFSPNARKGVNASKLYNTLNLEIINVREQIKIYPYIAHTGPNLNNRNIMQPHLATKSKIEKYKCTSLQNTCEMNI